MSVTIVDCGKMMERRRYFKDGREHSVEVFDNNRGVVERRIFLTLRSITVVEIIDLKTKLVLLKQWIT